MINIYYYQELAIFFCNFYFVTQIQLLSIILLFLQKIIFFDIGYTCNARTLRLMYINARLDTYMRMHYSLCVCLFLCFTFFTNSKDILQLKHNMNRKLSTQSLLHVSKFGEPPLHPSPKVSGNMIRLRTVHLCPSLISTYHAWHAMYSVCRVILLNVGVHPSPNLVDSFQM